MTAKRKQYTCTNGHNYFKSSDCRVCPLCETERKPNQGFLSKLSAPARRAIECEGISTIEQLSSYTQAEVLNLHGIGPSAMPILIKALAEESLTFKPPCCK